MIPEQSMKLAREAVIKELTKFDKELIKLHESHPGLLPKYPGEMSIADKLRFTGDLLHFLEIRDQYDTNSNPNQ